MAFPASESEIHDHHSSLHSQKPCDKDNDIDIDIDNNHDSDTQIRFLPLGHVYSTSSTTCVGSSNVVSKKVRARKLTLIDGDCEHYSHQQEQDDDEVVVLEKEETRLPQVIQVYSRRRLKKSNANSQILDSKLGYCEARGVSGVRVKSEYEGFDCDSRLKKCNANSPIFDSSVAREVSEVRVKSEYEDFDCDLVGSPNKKRRVASSELMKLGVDSGVLCKLNESRLRESRFQYNVSGSKEAGTVKRKPDNRRVKKWIQLALHGVDPMALVGLKCKVYWPLDDDWYKASVVGYDAESKQHNVKYDDGDEEKLILLNEQIKFHISGEEMQKLNIGEKKCTDDKVPDYNQLIGLAAMVDESQELEPGEIIWAKLSGYPMWPAVIMNEAVVRDRKGLSKGPGGRSVPVHFFGSHDFASIQAKQLVSFVKGLASGFHLKSKSPQFLRSLKEAKRYLNEQKLPESMLNLQRVCEGVQTIDSDEDSKKDEDISHSGLSKLSANKLLSQRYNMPRGYRPVRIDWKDLDRCNVCHMDEEYENNLFLQCDKCRMMVHARCYGEQSVDGSLWLCNLCRVGEPESTPPCRLCPVVGGAMKPTTDGHWAHLACAIWIPETCLSDIKRMEPINGVSRINKDRWKLICSICGVPYGACIQCSNNNCRVAYHPLCARAAGLCVEDFELEDEDRRHLISVDEDEKEQCIRLLSFCKRHKQPSNHCQIADEWIGKNTCYSSYSPPPNESGCARTEPYDYSSRRGRKEPEVLAAASAKRLFLENMPYLVGGYCLHDSMTRISEEKILIGSKISSGMQNRTSNQGSSRSILSMADKYKYMRETFRKRLAFGKSRIHGFGIFTKQPHKAGDMVIEYTGEIVRAPVADRRERFIYNSLVGAGTYMFRIDDERVIDATRAGSIAHLINHSCEPNCYSRVITVSGDEHIIIFAKRDIKQWEELTYDYRFFSIDEQLKCYCGSERCRGVVNDTEAEEQTAKLYVPRSELIDWRAE